MAPDLDARLAVEKVQAGCRICRNFLPRVHGPAYRRPGLSYLGACNAPDAASRLLSFNFSVTTTFILELFAGGMRIWSNGVLVPIDADIVLPYIQSELFEVQMRQVNDIVYLVHPNHDPIKIIRETDTKWTVSDVFNLLDGVPSGALSTGASGKALMEWWSAWSGVFPTTAPTINALPTDAGFDLPPTGSTDITNLLLPALPAAAGTFMRRVTGTLTVPTTGTWTIYIRAYFGGLFTVDGVNLAPTAGHPGLETPYTISLVAGQVYTFALYSWSMGLTVDTQVSISGPAYSKAIIPASLIAKPATAPSATATRATINQWPPMLDENITAITLACSATTGTDRTLTASSDLFLAGHVGSFWQIAHRRDDAYKEIIGTGGAPPGTSFAGTTAGLRILGRWDVYSYGTWSGTLHLERQNPVGTWDVLRTWRGNKDRNIIASGVEDQESILRLRAVGMSGEAATGASVPRFLIEAADAKIYGLVKVTSITSPTVAVVDVVKDLQSIAATIFWTEGAFSVVRGFPRAVGLHEQRLLFAGTKTNPLRLWGSVIGDIENFRRSSLDDGSFDFTLSAEESNAIQWIISFSDLIIGTSGEVWSGRGGTQDAPITPTSIKFTQGGRFGSDHLPAQLVNEVPAFVERTGRKVRKVTYSTEENKYVGSNLTVLAEHITKGRIIQTAFSAQPTAILWGVTGDGRLIGMTFENEQNVFAWADHRTSGTFESVAVIYGEDADEVWVTVAREVGGETVRYVERLDPAAMALKFESPNVLVYLDSATTFTFDTPTAALTGLTHLAGLEVGALLDGADGGTLTVATDGTLTLGQAASTVVVGLPYESLLQPMKQEFQMQDGTAQGRDVKVPAVVLRLLSSMGGEVADDPTGRFCGINYRTPQMAMDTAIPLFTGEKHVTLEAKHREAVNVIVRTTGPFPMNVEALTLQLDVYDT